MRGWLVEILCVMASLAGAVAMEVLPVAEAAKREGEEVRFVAEVKGVSRSPRSGALYVNFGDAYPRQILSARFAANEVEEAAQLPELLGRTVEVTGKVESTPSGPIVPVTDASQIAVRPLDTTGVLEQEGDGPAFQMRTLAAVRELFDKGDYGQLEKIEAKWRLGRERFRDGRWKLGVFYNAFSPPDSAPDVEWEGRLAKFDEWRRQFPHSFVPVIGKADLLVAYGWAARGSGWANTVTRDGWSKLAHRLDRARETLETVREEGEECPEWFAVMQKVALGQGWTPREARELFDRAVAAEPGYYEHYFGRAYYLLPRWHGSGGDWEAFLDTVEVTHPGGLGAELYARTAWAQRGFYGNLFDESSIKWPRMKAGFLEMQKRWPASEWNRSNFAFFAAMADDWKTALPLLDELGDRADMAVWVSWENVEMTRRWLTDASGKAPKPYIFRTKVERAAR